jgi:hypothetical protein
MLLGHAEEGVTGAWRRFWFGRSYASNAPTTKAVCELRFFSLSPVNGMAPRFYLMMPLLAGKRNEMSLSVYDLEFIHNCTTSWCFRFRIYYSRKGALPGQAFGLCKNFGMPRTMNDMA